MRKITIVQELVFRMSNSTFNYNQFHFLKGNRYGGSKEQASPTNDQLAKFNSKVKSLVKAIKSEGYDSNFPIEVAIIAGLLYVLDGQHRLAAAIQLNIQIPFVVLPNITTIEEAEVYCKKKNNSKGQVWPLSDYFYAAMYGVENIKMRSKYEFIDRLNKAFKVNLGTICDIAIGEGSTKTKGVIKTNGTFEIKNDIVPILELALQIATNSSTKPYQLMISRSFARCIARMFRHPLFNDMFLAKILAANITFDLNLMNNDAYVLMQLEDALNYRLHTNKIYLRDKNIGAKLS